MLEGLTLVPRWDAPRQGLFVINELSIARCDLFCSSPDTLQQYMIEHERRPRHYIADAR